jgi:hypothetical protein
MMEQLFQDSSAVVFASLVLDKGRKSGYIQYPFFQLLKHNTAI